MRDTKKNRRPRLWTLEREREGRKWRKNESELLQKLLFTKNEVKMVLDFFRLSSSSSGKLPHCQISSFSSSFCKCVLLSFLFESVISLHFSLLRNFPRVVTTFFPPLIQYTHWTLPTQWTYTPTLEMECNKWPARFMVPTLDRWFNICCHKCLHCHF